MHIFDVELFDGHIATSFEINIDPPHLDYIVFEYWDKGVICAQKYIAELEELHAT